MQPAEGYQYLKPFEYYYNKGTEIRPKRIIPPQMPKPSATSVEFRKYGSQLEVYEKEKKDYDEKLTAFYKSQNDLLDEFRKDALREVGLTDHPAADRVWHYVRSTYKGYTETFEKLEELAEVILG